MKKLYRKGTVHPSPPIISDHLSFLPAAILTLTAALSSEDREVLAYLISCSNNNSSGGGSSSFQGQRKSNQQKSGGVSLAKSRSSTAGNNNNDHPPLFTCDCFRCYMSYWVKWDASPNRQLIHEIIDAFEDHEMSHNNRKVKNSKKDKKKRGSGTDHKKNDHQLQDQQLLAAESESFGENRDGDDHEDSNKKGEGEEEEEKGSVRSFVSFIGERFWGVWSS